MIPGDSQSNKNFDLSEDASKRQTEVATSAAGQVERYDVNEERNR